ncbi:DUF3027 domain-containing protein [Gleimia sp. 6138-11-ORH1]|uniref:DUF3027 domain-containing protein n=1 Tax=Gleimia sp. 6138-11-ORH1 TaxID=2973937 RepID=UPI00216989D4|nr:DUF3027 domain-containing protein [Gleimia sp. 6138-11-ORH1]MCS4484752.1 DUF3027 domain-containing protein [Gleimia sp. 6138-11-ORH1]
MPRKKQSQLSEEVTDTSAGKTARESVQPKQIKADKVLAQARQQILEIISEVVPAAEIGAHLGGKVEGERLHTHFFNCEKPGYVGWQWVVTVARAPRSKVVTVCEIDLLPGKQALLAPAWIPWEERLKPGDVSPDDVLPYRAVDDRLTTLREAGKPADVPPYSRLRTLSAKGIGQTALRWKRIARTQSKLRKQTSACSSCGFLVPLEGPLKDNFGVCANEWSSEDGKLVPITFSCGAHSETDVAKQGSDWPVTPPRINELDLEMTQL